MIQTIKDLVSAKADTTVALAKEIWGYAELSYEETKSAAALIAALKQEGFTIEEGIADIPTAFTATYQCGSGKPVVGFLAEYDALSGLSQKAACPVQEPVTEGGAGHGCGHNLLGAGCYAAAVALKDYLVKEKKDGTVIFFGCPAEEGAGSKQFIARAGYFDNVDFAYTWHPETVNEVGSRGSVAIMGANFTFDGIAAHAGGEPHLGRSALDAVELLNVGVQFLREHMPSDCRVHYAITNAGGASPNVVQAEAEVMYLMRAPQLTQARNLNQRVDDIARGAALMTGTTLEIQFIKAVSNVLPNKVLGKQLQKNYDELGAARYDDADRALAAAMRDTMEQKDDYYTMLVNDIEDDALREALLAHANDPIYEEVLPYASRETSSMASSDVGDVSWVCPTAQISAATMPAGTGMHSWQEVAVGKSSMAHKGMLQAARILAATAIDALDDPDLIARAKAEKERRTGGQPYICPIPAGVAPQMQG